VIVVDVVGCLIVECCVATLTDVEPFDVLDGVGARSSLSREAGAIDTLVFQFREE
jgi:hypothetical protein